MRKIIYTRPDGGLAIVHPVQNDYEHIEGVTDLYFEMRAFDRLPDDAINPQLVDESAIPTDRTFRDAWAHGGTKVDVDMTKALGVHQDKLRSLRAPLLDGLDAEYLRALETGDSAMLEVVKNQKQALRDVTLHPAVLAATTPDDLKAAIPAILAVTAEALATEQAATFDQDAKP